MNSWLKLALYSFIGIIIGSFALGIIAPGYNTNNMNMAPRQMQMNGNYMGPGQMPMNGANMGQPQMQMDDDKMQMDSMQNMGGMQGGGMGMM